MQALRIGLFLSILLALLLGEAARSRAENWPQFRGPTGRWLRLSHTDDRRQDVPGGNEERLLRPEEIAE